MANMTETVLRDTFRGLREQYPEKLGRTSFKVNNRLKSRLGQAKFKRNRALGVSWCSSVEVAGWLLKDPVKAMDTLLHEVAHAIAGHAAGHGPKWKAVCRSIGAEPTRCGSSEVAAPPTGRYRGACGCDTPHQRHKMSKAIKAGYLCSKCRVRIEWTDTRTGRVVGQQTQPRRQPETQQDAINQIFGW